ncbi:Hpt domain-containing protein [Thioclava sp.]|uniref:Hpt domain-containing protein n=1 Tax=Thioclava sp. TaxID=1933450 RepID=UPI003AA90A63
MAILQAEHSSEDQSIASVIARIRGEFVATLMERSLVLESLKKEATSTQHPDRAISEMGEMAHKIAGVAETLGFPQLGRISLQLDGIIGSARSTKQAASQTWRIAEDVVEDLLDEMEALLDQSES